MEEYRLEEVASGVEAGSLWVSLGFSSQLEENDVLHLVCATTVDAGDRNGETADLYLERFDQAYSCSGGAELVLIAPSSVHVRLNEKGCEALDFVGGGVSFSVPAGLKGYEEAIEIFRRMAALECGKRVRVQIAG